MKKSTSLYSRRGFLKLNSITALGVGLGLSMVPNDAAASSHSLRIKPRYHRWHVDPGVEWLETNTGYATLDWDLPLSQTALVLVDVWQRHYLKDTEERSDRIINDKLVPMLHACRKSGLRIVHAPSPSVAQKHPNWIRLILPEEARTKRDNWPPAEFRSLSGPYRQYQRPHEPREEERRNLPELTFHPRVTPLSNEAVIASGEELHLYCKKEGIFFLLFAGFNTNACILSRDYGTIQMSNRGYQVVLIRDCTTGMESAETQPTLAQTNNAILLLEMFGQYSVASGDVISGFSTN